MATVTKNGIAKTLVKKNQVYPEGTTFEVDEKGRNLACIPFSYPTFPGLILQDAIDYLDSENKYPITRTGDDDETEITISNASEHAAYHLGRTLKVDAGNRVRSGGQSDPASRMAKQAASMIKSLPEGELRQAAEQQFSELLAKLSAQAQKAQEV